MKVIGYLFVGLLALSCFETYGAFKPYTKKRRVEYIEKVLETFDLTKPELIQNTYSYIGIVDKNNCKSGLSNLRVQCLMDSAAQNCRELKDSKAIRDCEFYSDIVIVNKLSENIFVSRSERYRMMKNASEDFRTVMANRLMQKYSRIVTQYSLSDYSSCRNKNFKCLAKGIDLFCREYTNTQSLSWQYCMSAIVWFIGTSYHK